MNFETKVKLVVHVDDMIIGGPKEAVRAFLKQLKEHLLFKEQPVLAADHHLTFLGRQITQVSDRVLQVTPNLTIMDRLKEIFSLQETSNPVPTPTIATWKRGEGTLLDSDLHSQFRTAIGIMQYVAGDRPDMLYAIRSLARCLSSPTDADFQAAKRAARYLLSTADQSLTFSPADETCRSHLVHDIEAHASSGNNRLAKASSIQILTHCDADHAKDLQSGKSVSGGIISVMQCPIMHWARTQSVPTLSSGESELLSITTAACESLYVRGLLHDFGVRCYCMLASDSTAAIAICGRIGAGKVRHLDTRFLYVQQLLREGLISIRKVDGAYNVSDILTKAVSAETLNRLWDQLSLTKLCVRCHTISSIIGSVQFRKHRG
jgi:hypothetical protein